MGTAVPTSFVGTSAVPTSFVGTSAVPTNLSEQTTISNSADRTLLLKLQEEEVFWSRSSIKEQCRYPVGKEDDLKKE